MDKKKSIILILGGIIVILIIALYFYFRTSTVAPVPVNNIPDTSTGFGNTSANINTSNGNGFGTSSNSSGTLVNSSTTQAQLKQIFSEPNAGAVIFKSGGEEKIRLVEKSNGHIQEASFVSSQVVRISNTTIPKIYEALWDKTGGKVVLRYIKDETGKMQTYSAKINVSTSTSNESVGIISGTFLPENIRELSVNKNISKVFYLMETSNGGSAGFTANLDGTQSKQVFSSELKNWNIGWAGDNTLSLLSRPSYTLKNILFSQNASGGSLEKIIGNMYGMTTLVGDNGNKVVYSQNVRSVPTLGYYNVKTDVDNNLSLSTIADKCVWSNVSANIVYCAVPKTMPRFSYPDDWYKGKVSFSDDFWQINLDNNTTTLLYQTKGNENVDATNLIASAKDDYIVFTNKKDLSLWSFKTSPQTN